MGRAVKTEAIVLRSIRYGEADRILHLYTPGPGRVGRDRQGRPPRAQPLRRAARAVLPRPHRCCTKAAASCSRSPASTRSTRTPRCATRARTLDAAARACDAVARLFETAEPHPEVFTLLCQRARAARRATPSLAPARPTALAFRLKLLLAAGIAAAARCVRVVRRARAPAGLLGRGRRRGLRVVRGGRVPARRGGLPVPVSAVGQPLAQAAGGVRALAAPGRAGDRGDGRAPRQRAPAAAAEPPRVIGTPARARCQNRSSVTDRILLAGYEHPTGPVADALRARGSVSARSASCRRWRRAPTRPSACARSPTAGCAPRFSATATGSSTARRSGG